MGYIRGNKLAWEEAFERRRPGWGENHWEQLAKETLPFLGKDVIREMKTIGLAGKTIAQFCCNNGRELLSAMQLGPEFGVGFDIAENFIEQARLITTKIERKNAEFVACNVLDIDEAYHSRFDFIFLTVGAITWFQDLAPLFGKISSCLRPGGALLLNDSHPFMNMLPLPGETDYDPDKLNRITYPYFRDEPWIENQGMDYITPKYDSKTFCSFAHTMSAIITALVRSGISVCRLHEYDYDVGLTGAYDGKGLPLSYILVGKKQ